MRAIFNDSRLEEEFRKKGYVIVPFLNQAEAVALRSEASKLKPSDNFEGDQETAIGKQSFHVTFFDTIVEYKKNVFDFIQSVFNPAATQLLNNYKCAQANIFLKPGKKGFVYPHQNLTIVDEARYTSLSFWTPLQDTGFANGTLCVVPGSQIGFVKYRNTHVYWPYVKFFKEGRGLHYFETISVKAGELLILDDRIIHYTPVNTSADARWVLHALWAPSEAQLLFCDPTIKTVNIFEVPDDFWQFHAPGTLIENREPDMWFANNETLLNEEMLTKKLEELKRLQSNPE